MTFRFALTSVSAGGVQNSGRKDKKEKKSSGIRSIRGFV